MLFRFSRTVAVFVFGADCGGGVVHGAGDRFVVADDEELSRGLDLFVLVNGVELLRAFCGTVLREEFGWLFEVGLIDFFIVIFISSASLATFVVLLFVVLLSFSSFFLAFSHLGVRATDVSPGV